MSVRCYVLVALALGSASAYPAACQEKVLLHRMKHSGQPAEQAGQAGVFLSVANQIADDFDRKKANMSYSEVSSFGAHLTAVRNRISAFKDGYTPEQLKEKTEINEMLVKLRSLVPKDVTSSTGGKSNWPPRDGNGNIIPGPIKSGTREQIGWPMYGYPEEEYRKHEFPEAIPAMPPGRKGNSNGKKSKGVQEYK